jgi:AraC-like DNA-binding protein
MLKARRTTLRDGDTVGRLRRGLASTQSPRPVDVMARAACFSRRQFHRLMVQVLGETPGTHQRRLRLDRGAWLLLTSRATVLDVALETGFENHETFTRAFRTRFGVTPSAFRKNRGKTLPRSIRVGLSIALNAATRSTSSGQAMRRGYPPSGDFGVASRTQK